MAGKKRFGIGIIGCGGIASAHVAAYQQFPDDCEIVAVSDVRPEAMERLAARVGAARAYPRWQDLLADARVDIVSICTPHDLHAPMALAAAKAGKHIMGEKPMAMTVGEAHEMIAACREQQVKLSIGSERFNPRLRFIKERVLPELGPIAFSWLLSAYYRDSAYYASAAWRGTWAHEGGGVCPNQAIYVWDQWQWLLGGVELAYGYWTNILHPTIEVEDLAYGLVKFKNGAVGKWLATTCGNTFAGEGGLRIFGENGTIYARDEWLYGIDFSLKDVRREAGLREEFARAVDPQYDGHYQPWQVADLFAAIREDRETLVPEALEALKILNGVHWHGWRHADKFKAWAAQRGLPASIEAAKAQEWDGGRLMAELASLIKTPTPTLAAPFLAG
jgi:predicted dehydrogenase